MKQQIDIRKAGGIIIRDRKALITRSRGKDIFVQLGGKLEGEETFELALVRELQEELNLDVTPKQFEELGIFYAPAAGNEHMMLELKAFLVKDVTAELKPASEVEELRWIDSNFSGIEIGSIMEHDILPLLKSRGLID